MPACPCLAVRVFLKVREAVKVFPLESEYGAVNITSDKGKQREPKTSVAIESVYMYTLQIATLFFSRRFPSTGSTLRTTNADSGHVSMPLLELQAIL